MNKTNLLHRAIRRILRPIVSMLIKSEVSHSEFAELTREVYVDVARKNFALPNRKCTTSRIAVLTGLSRKEVVRLSKENLDAESQDASLDGAGGQKYKPNRAARVVTGWLNDEDFLTPEVAPRVLPLRGEVSFATLVERYSGDITAGAVLDELLRIGVVEHCEGDRLALLKAGYIPDADDIDSIEILSDCSANLLNTAVFNTNRQTNEPARFQRQLVERDVPEPLAAEFARYSNQKSMDLLLDCNKWLEKKKHGMDAETAGNSRDVDRESNASLARVGIGIYYFEDQSYE